GPNCSHPAHSGNPNTPGARSPRPLEPAHEPEQPSWVTQRRAVTKAGQPGLQLGQACGRSPIHGGVEREDSLRFAQFWQASPDMHVGQDVAQDEHPVLLAPEREMPGRMTRCFEHPETSDVITLAELARHGVRGTDPVWTNGCTEPVERHPGHD